MLVQGLPHIVLVGGFLKKSLALDFGPSLPKNPGGRKFHKSPSYSSPKMALRFLVLGLVCTLGWSAATCDGNICEADLEIEEMNVELLQTAVAVGKREVQQPAIPFWCYSMDAYSRSRTSSCTGGPGSCACMGPAVCGGNGPFQAGSWQSYSYSCCACGGPLPQAVPPPAAVVPAAAPAAPATPAAAPAAVDPKADCSAHPACNSLKLTGSCCPAVDGTMLGCCTSLLETEKLEVNSTALPAWCDKVTVDGVKAPPCDGSGSPSSCSCVSKSVCGAGAPLAGSWQAYSTACCGCM